MQHSAAQCSTLQHSAAQFCTPQQGAHYNTLYTFQHTAAHCTHIPIDEARTKMREEGQQTAHVTNTMTAVYHVCPYTSFPSPPHLLPRFGFSPVTTGLATFNMCGIATAQPGPYNTASVAGCNLHSNWYIFSQRSAPAGADFRKLPEVKGRTCLNAHIGDKRKA